MAKILRVFFLLLVCNIAQAQIIKGTITDAETGEPLLLVNVQGPNKSGTVSDAQGRYQLEVPTGENWLQFSMLGYATQKLKVIMKNADINLDVQLVPLSEELETVVISAGKYEQRAEDVSVSIEVIKPDLVQEKNTIELQDIFNQTPGVNVTDDQANIRSGSGWSFGAGSRVLMLVDDMPMMSPDAGQIQWSLLPYETILQMEVIKGASSALYGTSALNGLINVRTIYPSQKPKTEVALFGGFYDAPKRASLKWWDGTQAYGGFHFLHSRKVKNADITISGLFNRDPGFRYEVNDNRNRLNVKTQFYPQKTKGLTWGINASALYSESGDALLWMDYENAYIARDSATTKTNGWDYYIDPFIQYNRGRAKHTLRGRFLGINNDARSPDVSYANNSTYYYSEYQFQYFFSQHIWITTGAVGALGYSQSDVFMGYHETQNGAAFIQGDIKLKRWNFTAGMRYEAFALDDRKFQKPVFRAGINYQLGRATFLRASYGGGYRFPSMAEVYTRTEVGAAGVYPNYTLQPESGWSAEFGVKQGIQLGSQWRGFFDVAAFINHYDNMTEFSFGFWGDSPNAFENLGFRSLNVGPTQITGIETTLSGNGKIGPVRTRVLLGYAYTLPIALEPNNVYGEYQGLGGVEFDVSYNSTSADTTNSILKYRYQHLAKADVLFEYKKFGVGLSARYNDFMQNIDQIFVSPTLGSLISPGVAEARDNLNNGDLVFDVRFLYQISPQWRVAFLVDNLTNTEVMPRPAQLGPPRKFTLQLKFSM